MEKLYLNYMYPHMPWIIPPNGSMGPVLLLAIKQQLFPRNCSRKQNLAKEICFVAKTGGTGCPTYQQNLVFIRYCHKSIFFTHSGQMQQRWCNLQVLYHWCLHKNGNTRLVFFYNCNYCIMLRDWKIIFQYRCVYTLQKINKNSIPVNNSTLCNIDKASVWSGMYSTHLCWNVSA